MTIRAVVANGDQWVALGFNNDSAMVRFGWKYLLHIIYNNDPAMVRFGCKYPLHIIYDIFSYISYICI